MINKLKIIVLIIISTTVSYAKASETEKIDTTSSKQSTQEQIEKDFDSLGGNTVLLEKARALNPEVHTTIIQNRLVDRKNKIEISGLFDNSIGGDTYIRNSNLGLATQFHFNNQWSLGAKYGVTYNKLSNEGNSLVDQAIADHNANPSSSKAPIPDIDYPKNWTMGFVNFYPIYGKISWLGQSISHFDIYAQLGYGNISLNSGGTNATSGAIGMGIWGHENVTTRIEMQYMSYEAKYFSGPLKLGITSASMQLGWLF